jgi:hypothetical protein
LFSLREKGKEKVLFRRNNEKKRRKGRRSAAPTAFFEKMDGAKDF